MTEFLSDPNNAVFLGFIITIVVALLGFCTDRALKYLTAKLDRNLQIAKEKLPAMQSLWELTEPLNLDRADEPDREELILLQKKITHWYYEIGNGIFLSDRERTYWRFARSVLINEPDFNKIKDVFSMLRTIIKWKLNIYDADAARSEIKSKIEYSLKIAEAWANPTDKQGAT